MKIVLFTPAARVSAIGRMAALVSRELIANGNEVAIVRTERDDLLASEAHSFGVVPIAWTDHASVESALVQADIVVHQIGNSFDFHEGSLSWLDSYPAAVCLHDFFLGHLFFGWAQQAPERARAILRYWYGTGADDAFFSHAAQSDFLALACDSAPMTEWVCSRAAAVITHSSWGIARVLAACQGPVWTLPLAYDILPSDRTTDDKCRDSGSDVLLLTVGHVNSNKRAAQVIQAIGSDAVLRDRITYRLIGLVEPATVLSLTSLASSLGVRLDIGGEVESDVLTDAFHDADIVSCLRWPSLESASASAVEAMLHGKATLVTDTAFYSEIPDDCVVKINPRNEAIELVDALRRLCGEPMYARQLGERARKWASEMFRANHYAERLVDMAEPLRRAAWLRRGAQPFVDNLGCWGGSASMLGESWLSEPLSIVSA